jgi:hypothetical protein
MSSLSDLRLKAGQNKITERDQELMKKFTENPIDSNSMPELFSDQMTCFLFESVIRPLDNALVIHLKHLPPAFRNPRFFDFATEFIRDRIGKFESLNASFIGELDSANKLNSLDLMFTKYYPALMGDMDFIKQHTAKVGKQLNDLLVRELDAHIS